ncbi:hypothetical protein BH11BAC1_BH11BAC1_09360 [soil metagenome]
MKKIKQLLSVILLTFCVETSFSQTTDSLNVFPNPFYDAAIIYFDIVQSDTITLRVFDIIGKTIKTFFNETILPTGSYKINMTGDSLADGIYFIRIDIGSAKTLTKPLTKTGSTWGALDYIDGAGKYFVSPPATTNNLITIPLDGIKTFIVADMNGKVLKSFSTDKQVISLLDISPGIYFITILTNKNEKLKTKIVLTRE